jgi:hypothetical protein
MQRSYIKLGLTIAWPAFWTGVPLKIVLVLLFLAAGTHPWEMPALGLLLLLSIPIDIWALNLTARTVFLERLHLEPPEGLGLKLWAQIAPLTAIYIWIGSKLEGWTIEIAKAVAARVMDLFKGLAVAERISIELVLWAAPSTIVLIILLLGWLFAVGWIVQRQAAVARPAQATYPVLVRRWDLLRIPADQPLTLTAFLLSGIVLVLLFWAFIPVKTPHPHEMYKQEPAKAAKPVMPIDVLQKTETVIAQAEASVKALEAKGSSKGKAGKLSSPNPAPTGKRSTPVPVGERGQGKDHDTTPHSH